MGRFQAASGCAHRGRGGWREEVYKLLQSVGSSETSKEMDGVAVG